MKNLLLLLSCVALPASAQLVVRPVSGAPSLGAASAAWTPDALVGRPMPALAVSPAPLLLAPAIPVPAPTPVAAAIPAPIVAKAAVVAAAPALKVLPAAASAESRTEGGRIVFDHAGVQAAGREDAAPVIASGNGAVPAALKPAAPAKTAAAAFVPLALAAAQSANSDWIPAVIMGVMLIGVLLLLRWSKKNLGKITAEEIAEFQKTIEARKDEWLKIPGVKSLEIVSMSRMDDTPPAYLRIVVDHIGPDNKDLLPQNHRNWSPVIASMFPQSLREAARIGSLDGKGYWPIAVDIAR